jgi:hypothetical protein
MASLFAFKYVVESAFQLDIATVQGEGVPGPSGAGLDFETRPSVRRPTRGILLGEETYASIAVEGPISELESTSATEPSGGLLNSSIPGKLKTYTTNFLLQSITETRSEKVQYVTTFGSTYAFFFGEQPRIINCSAVLLNTPDFNWEKEWWVNYGRVLRGTSLTSSNSFARLTFEGQTIVGYLTNCTTIKNAQDPHLVNLNFSMFVEKVEYDESVGSDEPYGSRSPTTRADFLGVGNVIDRDDLQVLRESTTSAVRRANIKISALNDSGFAPGGLLNALGAIDGAITNFIRNARNILYGRNLVVPRSFTGERASQPIFPEGTGAEDLEGKTISNFWGKSLISYSDGGPVSGGTSVTLRTNTDDFSFLEYLESRKPTRYTWENFDEYVSGVPSDFTPVLTQFVDIPDPDQLFLNQAAVAAFSAFGLKGAVTEYVAGGDPVTTATTNYSAYLTKQRTSSVLRGLGRVAFGVATFAYGTSVVNRRREIQESITNPNTGGLDANTLAQLQSEIVASNQSAEQERLRQEAEANALRGNTGTVRPNIISTIGGILT